MDEKWGHKKQSSHGEEVKLSKQSFIWKWQAAEPGFGDETRAGWLCSPKHVGDIYSHETYLRSSREETHKRPRGLS